MPNFGKASHPETLAELAGKAEKCGWDGFFLWNHIVEWDKQLPIYDSFTSLAAIALKTNQIQLGTTVTPLPRFKPWEVARQTVSLDHLSQGRLTLGVGLGARESCDYERFGESADNKILAEKLDESLRIIAGLWTGRPFSYQGRHYRVQKTTFPTATITEAQDTYLGWRVLAEKSAFQARSQMGRSHSSKTSRRTP